MRVTIFALPVEIPLLDPEHPLFRPVREDGPALQVAGQIVRMRVDRQEVGIDRHRERIGHDDVGGSGGKIQAEGGQLEFQIGVQGRGLREMKPEHRLDRLGFPRAVQVELHDQIARFGEPPGKRVRRHEHHLAGLPGEKVSGGHFRPDVHAGKAGRALAAFHPSAGGRLIEQHEGVMHGPGISGENFQRADEAVLSRETGMTKLR